MDGKRPVVSSVHGMVAAAHPLAAAAGARMLAMGGNAFDAAAATTAALNVVEPYMSGLAGLGYATCYIAAEQRVRCLNYAPRIPSKFPAGTFAEREEIQRHPLASGTPGNLAGWCELVRAHGKLSLAEVFAPAIALARDGFPLGRFNVELTNLSCVQLHDHPQYAELNRVYAAGKGAVKLGQVLKQPDLAATYEGIVANGPGYLYGGPLGKKMAEYLQSIGGCITEADLAAVKPEWVDPISVDYRGLKVHTMAPPSEGFQWLLTLRILEGFDLSRMERNGVDHLDTVYRAIRLAAGVRIARNNPKSAELAEILSDAHVAQLRARVADGVPIEGPTEQFVTPKPIDLNKEHTTSLSIADKFGNAVCITQSLGAGFGNGIVIPGTGVCMNNFLYWSEVDTGGRAPLVAGGEIALCVAPSIGTRDGRLVLSIGTPGSYGILQTQVQALVQYVDFGLEIQDAIAAPRARLWDGMKVDVEGRIRAEVVAALVRRGHGATSAPDFTMQVGGMQAVAIDPDSGALTGAADPRRDSYAVAP